MEDNYFENNKDRRRYELHVDGNVCIIDYMVNNEGNMYMTHTEVPQVLEGKGHGSRLVKNALEDAEKNGYKIVPMCPFVAVYIRRHPEWKKLLAPGFNV